MSKEDRNQHMQIAFNQWMTTKDGKITAKTSDIKHAFAVGFKQGRINKEQELKNKNAKQQDSLRSNT